jgi:hypothetical protein
LRVSSHDGSSWSKPSTVASGTQLLANWADTPTLRDLGGDRLAVSWPVKREGGHAYDLAVAFSTDGGRTWGPPVTPHDDDTDTEHGFPAFGPGSDSGVLLAWLDGRDYASRAPEKASMSLRVAHVGADGEVAGERVLDARTCDCCPVSATLTGEGFALAYRDRSAEGELRDIALVRRDGTNWSEPALVHADGWSIAGCPVNGPAVDADGRALAAAWFTAADGVPSAWVAFSSDGGRSFGPPVRVDEGEPGGRVALVLLEDGTAAVSWVEGEQLRLRRVASDGESGPVLGIASLPPGRPAGMPRLVRWGDALATAVTADGEPGRVRVARAPIPPS